MMEFPKQFFISGTDTDIGKTLVSTMLMCTLDATYWKPIQSGLEQETDTQFVQRISEANEARIIPERWRLSSSMSPHTAADIDEVSISLDDFKLPDYTTKHLIIEGAGGLIVPINWEHTVLDLIEKFALPVLLVAKSGLGTLNHTLLSLKALRDRGIEVFAVILNGSHHKNNRDTLQYFGKLPIYEIGNLPSINKEALQSAFKQLASTT